MSEHAFLKFLFTGKGIDPRTEALILSPPGTKITFASQEMVVPDVEWPKEGEDILCVGQHTLAAGRSDP